MPSWLDPFHPGWAPQPTVNQSMAPSMGQLDLERFKLPAPGPGMNRMGGGGMAPPAQVPQRPQGDLVQAIQQPKPAPMQAQRYGANVPAPPQPHIPAAPQMPQVQMQPQAQRPMWPIPQAPPGREPYEVAAMRQNRELAKSVAPPQAQFSAPNFSEVGGAGGQYYQSPQYTAWQQGNQNARADLFRQYHGGWDPGEFQQLQKMGSGNSIDQYLQQKVQNPTASYEGGIPVHRGVPTRTVITRDSEGNPMAVNMPEFSSTGEWADAVRGDAMAKLAGMERHKAEMAALDPNKQIGLLEKLGADPRLLGTYLAGHGHDPNLAAQIPPARQPGAPVYGLGNLEQAATDPETAYLHQALGPDSGLDLTRKLDLASRLMESGNPKYNDYVKAWMQRQQATDDRWQRDVADIMGRPQTAEGINQLSAAHYLGGLFGADRQQELARNERARRLIQMFPGVASPSY